MQAGEYPGMKNKEPSICEKKRPATIRELPLELPGKIYVGPMPYGYFDPDGKALDDFKSKNISLIVMLVQESEYRQLAGIDLPKLYSDEGYDLIHLPLLDFSIPQKGFFDSTVAKIITRANESRNVVIHCHAGLGRAGLVAGLLIMRVLGLPGEQAVTWLRKYAPGSLPSHDQLRFITESATIR